MKTIILILTLCLFGCQHTPTTPTTPTTPSSATTMYPSDIVKKCMYGIWLRGYLAGQKNYAAGISFNDKLYAPDSIMFFDILKTVEKN